MKEISNPNLTRVWQVVDLLFFIGALLCIRYYICINGNESSLGVLLLNITIILTILAFLGFLMKINLELRKNKEPSIKPLTDSLKIDNTSISEEDAEHVRQIEEENKRKEEEKWQEIVSYTKATFQKILTPSQIEILLNNILQMTLDKKFEAVETSANKFLKPNDLLHFGWNVGRRLLPGRKNNFGKTTAKFLKESFKITLHETEETTIPSKLTIDDDKALPLIILDKPLVPYIFPGTEDLPVLS